MLKFAPFSSLMKTPFWHKLSHNKLNEYGLDDSYNIINGYYCNYLSENHATFLNFDDDSFDKEYAAPRKCCKVLGYLKIFNTMEDFVSSDKKALITFEGQKIWNSILSGEALQNPSLLATFVLLTYADLKKFKFYYWTAFPALNVKERFSILDGPCVLTSRYNQEMISMFIKTYDEFSKEHGFPPVFLVRKMHDNVEFGILDEFHKWKNDPDEVTLAFADPSTYPEHPGWPLRNYLVCLSCCWFNDLKGCVNVLCLRDQTRGGVRSISHSLLFRIKLIDLTHQSECPDVVGWETYAESKSSHRSVDLSSELDPLKLSESSVDLNLKLMKWRLLPDLNLDVISSARFLLLGSGTLGCNVARCLMGWGVRNITLVDNAKVSFSNPVRQSLFTYSDCLQGGRAKAQAAAEAMKLIFPQVNAVGVELSIPMPGHHISNQSVEKVKKNVSTLEQLIKDHDVIYLLMDTRESRWLPTLIGKAESKIVISASLGFGTFLVIRHGLGHLDPDLSPEEIIRNKVISGNHLGCYFCNDVTSPGNSTIDRSLDQQCTVTRPGISMMASACSVELAMSILQHPLRGEASACIQTTDEYDSDESILGVVPHQIRGFLASFSNVSTATCCFDKCTACSTKVLEAYRREGFDFLLKVFNSPSLLEDITGLSLLKQEAADDSIIDFSDED